MFLFDKDLIQIIPLTENMKLWLYLVIEGGKTIHRPKEIKHGRHFYGQFL